MSGILATHMPTVCVSTDYFRCIGSNPREITVIGKYLSPFHWGAILRCMHIPSFLPI